MALLDGHVEITIGGNLQVFGTSATDVAGLGNLTSIGGSLSMAENSELRSIHGLVGLQSFAGQLGFHANPKLCFSEVSVAADQTHMQIDTGVG